jgi:hypothetical protein
MGLNLSTLSLDNQVLYISSVIGSTFGTTNERAFTNFFQYIGNGGGAFYMEEEKGARITIRVERDWKTSELKSSVSWSSIGSVPANEAHDFGNALVNASLLAARLVPIFETFNTLAFGSELEQAYRAWFLATFPRA